MNRLAPSTWEMNCILGKSNWCYKHKIGEVYEHSICQKHSNGKAIMLWYIKQLGSALEQGKDKISKIAMDEKFNYLSLFMTSRYEHQNLTYNQTKQALRRFCIGNLYLFQFYDSPCERIVHKIRFILKLFVVWAVIHR